MSTTFSRARGIAELMAAWQQRDSEFCVGAEEYEESDRELRASLRALGVTDEEMDADFDWATTRRPA